MRQADIVTGVLLLGAAIFLVIDASQMPYMTEDGVPGPGFWPLWIALCIGLLSLLLLFQALRNRSQTYGQPVITRVFWRNALVVIGGSAVAMALVPLIGMLVAVGLLVGFLSWALGTRRPRTNLLLVVLSPLCFLLVFEKGLDVQLPVGLFGF